jgi:ubiquinone/menaquinone biosynthesis C-methylase UbiE
LALDREKLTANLHSFYDFEGKVVLCVGAGSGQLLDKNIRMAETVLIDRDDQALAKTDTRSLMNDRQGPVRSVLADFKDLNIPGDVVYFEFCLHEMDDPQQAIDHARALAPDVVVFDHSPSSDWVFYAAEEKKVRRSAEALAHFNIKRHQSVYAEQAFKDHLELLAKLKNEGELAIQRAARFAGATNIVIPMPCDLTLL